MGRVNKNDFIRKISTDNNLSLETAKTIYNIFCKTLNSHLKEKKDVTLETCLAIKFTEQEAKDKLFFGKYKNIKTKKTKCNILVAKPLKDKWD